MLKGLRRLLGIVSAYSRRWWAGFRLWPMIAVAIAIIALLLTSAAPYMRIPGRKWNSWDSWTAAGWELVLIFVCVTYLRYEEKFRKILASKDGSHDWRVRMAELAKIIDDVYSTDQRQRNTLIPRIRSDILRCIVWGLSEVLDLPRNTLCANLIEFKGSLDSMVAVARSDNLRPLNTEYPTTEEFVPWRAIKNATLEVEDNFRVSDGGPPRGYRSIVAVPVTRAGRAYGAVSIDCTTAYAFSGRQVRVLYQIRPYIALIALTYGDSSLHYECQFNPAHVRGK